MENIFDLKKISPLKKLHSKYIKSRMTNENLPASFLPFIEALSKQKFRSQQELTEYLGCNKAHTSRTLLAMKLKGLIKPSYCKNAIELTEKGKSFVSQLDEIEKDFVTLLSANITENEKNVFNKVLDTFLINANQI